MSINLSQKDWLMISAYLDGRLGNEEKAAFETRLSSDAGFKAALQEFQYNRRLLRSLPQRRAPRNFTLSSQYAKKNNRRWGLNQFFGLTSATAAIALVAFLAWTNLITSQTKMAAPAPFSAAVPEAAMDSSAATANDASNPPMIIYWGQPQSATGKGGGGGGGDGTEAFTTSGSALNPGAGGGGIDTLVPEILVPSEPTESPLMTEKLEGTADPSTLILGLPEPGTEGETIQRNASQPPSAASPLPARTIWMIGLGAVTLIFALLAIFLRKR